MYVPLWLFILMCIGLVSLAGVAVVFVVFLYSLADAFHW